MKTIICDIPSWKEYLRGKRTLEIGYPWLAMGSILSLEVLLNREMRVLELGSGGSTVFFSRKCKEVVSIETEFSWADKTEEAIKFFNLTNVILHKIEFSDLVDFLKKDTSKYDVVLIDHIDPTSKRRREKSNRWAAGQVAMDLVKVGGWMIIDNYNNYGMSNFPYREWDVFTYDEAVINYNGSGTRLCRKRG